MTPDMFFFVFCCLGTCAAVRWSGWRDQPDVLCECVRLRCGEELWTPDTSMCLWYLVLMVLHFWCPVHHQTDGLSDTPPTSITCLAASCLTLCVCVCVCVFWSPDKESSVHSLHYDLQNTAELGEVTKAGDPEQRAVSPTLFWEMLVEEIFGSVTNAATPPAVQGKWDLSKSKLVLLAK